MKDNNNKICSSTVVVIGCNYSSNLCMARSLGQAGYSVEMVRVFQHKPKLMGLMRLLKPEACSRYVTKYSECFANGEPSRVAQFLMENAQDKKLVVPTDDYNAAAIDESYDMLKEKYIMPNVADTQGSLCSLMSKETQMQLARRYGVETISSCLVTAQDGVFELPQGINYPCFIKPDVSKNSSKSYMKKCDSKEELSAALTSFSKGKKIDMIVEDYLEIDREYSLLGLCTKGKAVAPGLFVAQQGGSGDRRGITLVGKMVDTEPYRKEIEQILRFVEKLDFEGLFDVDLIGTKDGKLHFIELNMRYGASGYAVTENGANLPGAFADYMLAGRQMPADLAVKTTGTTFVSEKVMVEEYIKGPLSAGKVKQLIAQADVHFIKNDRDTAPYRHFKKFFVPATAMKLAYTAKRTAKGS